jgi:hypothetical protein
MNFRAIILTILLSAQCFAAQSIVLGWDANPAGEGVTKYYVYEKVGTNWVQLGQTSQTTFTLPDVPPGPHVYAVTAYNFRESERSAEVTLPPGPGAPRNVRVVVEVTVP